MIKRIIKEDCYIKPNKIFIDRGMWGITTIPELFVIQNYEIYLDEADCVVCVTSDSVHPNICQETFGMCLPDYIQGKKFCEEIHEYLKDAFRSYNMLSAMFSIWDHKHFDYIRESKITDPIVIPCGS